MILSIGNLLIFHSIKSIKSILVRDKNVYSDPKSFIKERLMEILPTATDWNEEAARTRRPPWRAERLCLCAPKSANDSALALSSLRLTPCVASTELCSVRSRATEESNRIAITNKKIATATPIPPEDYRAKSQI